MLFTPSTLTTRLNLSVSIPNTSVGQSREN